MKHVCDLENGERCGYMTNRRGKGLFYQRSSLHPNQPLIVFSSPLLEEPLFCKNHIASWLRHLSDQNHNVLTFDYEGSGNSEGEYPVSANQMVNDLVDVIGWYQHKYPAQPVYLIGIRFGLNIVAKAAEQMKAERIVGVEPILDPHNYWLTLLRSNLTTQLSVFGKVVENRKRLMRKLGNGERVNISGYEIDLDFCQSLLTFGLHNCTTAVAEKSMLFLRAGNRKKRSEKKALLSAQQRGFQYKQIEMDPFWGETSLYRPFQSTLFQETDRFLTR